MTNQAQATGSSRNADSNATTRATTGRGAPRPAPHQNPPQPAEGTSYATESYATGFFQSKTARIRVETAACAALVAKGGDPQQLAPAIYTLNALLREQVELLNPPKGWGLFKAKEPLITDENDLRTLNGAVKLTAEKVTFSFEETRVIREAIALIVQNSPEQHEGLTALNLYFQEGPQRVKEAQASLTKTKAAVEGPTSDLGLIKDRIRNTIRPLIKEKSSVFQRFDLESLKPLQSLYKLCKEAQLSKQALLIDINAAIGSVNSYSEGEYEPPAADDQAGWININMKGKGEQIGDGVIGSLEKNVDKIQKVLNRTLREIPNKDLEKANKKLIRLISLLEFFIQNPDLNTEKKATQKAELLNAISTHLHQLNLRKYAGEKITEQDLDALLNISQTLSIELQNNPERAIHLARQAQQTLETILNGHTGALTGVLRLVKGFVGDFVKEIRKSPDPHLEAAYQALKNFQQELIKLQEENDEQIDQEGESLKQPLLPHRGAWFESLYTVLVEDEGQFKYSSLSEEEKQRLTAFYNKFNVLQVSSDLLTDLILELSPNLEILREHRKKHKGHAKNLQEGVDVIVENALSRADGLVSNHLTEIKKRPHHLLQEANDALLNLEHELKFRTLTKSQRTYIAQACERCASALDNLCRHQNLKEYALLSSDNWETIKAFAQMTSSLNEENPDIAGLKWALGPVMEIVNPHYRENCGIIKATIDEASAAGRRLLNQATHDVHGVIDRVEDLPSTLIQKTTEAVKKTFSSGEPEETTHKKRPESEIPFELLHAKKTFLALQKDLENKEPSNRREDRLDNAINALKALLEKREECFAGEGFALSEEEEATLKHLERRMGQDKRRLSEKRPNDYVQKLQEHLTNALEILEKRLKVDQNRADVVIKAAIDYLSKTMNGAGDIVKAKLFSMGAEVLLRILDDLKKQSKDNRPLYDMIKKLTSRLTAAEDTGNGNDVKKALQAVYKELKGDEGHGFYVLGFPVLGGSNETTSSFNQANIKHLKKAKKYLEQSANSPSNQPVGDPAALLEQRTQSLTKKIGLMASFRAIFESGWFCGLKPNTDDFYNKIIHEAFTTNPAQANSLARKALFERIDAAKLSTLRTTWAKAVSFVLVPILQGAIYRFANNAMTFAKEYIKENKDKGFAPLKDQFVKNASNYVARVNQIHTKIAAGKENMGSRDSVIKKRLDSPECNDSLTPEQLYQGFTSAFIDKFFSGISLTDSVRNAFSLKAPAPLLGLNLPPIKSIAYFPLLFSGWIMQTLLNPILNRTLKHAMNRNHAIETLVRQSVGALQDPHGHTPALTLFIRNKLRGACQSILKEGAPTDASDQNGVSSTKIDEFKEVVENLFEIFTNMDYRTQNKLNQHLNRPSVFQQLTGMFDDAILQKAADGAVAKMAAAIANAYKDSQMDGTLYELVSSLDNSFAPSNKKVSEQELKTAEIEIKEMTDMLMNHFIMTALNDQFNVSMTKKKIHANNIIDKQVKKPLRKFIEKTEEALKTLNKKQLYKDEVSEAKETLEALLKKVEKFETSRALTNFSAENHTLTDSIMRKKLNRIKKNINESLTLMGEQLKLTAKIVKKEDFNKKNIEKIKNHIKKTRIELNKLKETERQISRLEFPNYYPKQANIFLEFVKDQALHALTKRKDSFFKFAAKPYNYENGLALNLIMRPFVENYAPKQYRAMQKAK